MSLCGVVCLVIAMRGGTPDAAQGVAAPRLSGGMREVFPGVRADIGAKVVEFDGTMSPLLVKDQHAPLFFLEVIACSPNTREHETLVVSDVRPSNIHAAMLAIGLNPGKPGGWKMVDGKLEPVSARGDRVSLRVVYVDKEGRELATDPLEWVVSSRDGKRFAAAESRIAGSGLAPGWVFAGSRLVKKTIDGTEREVYDADGAGSIIGLTTFGLEVIGWSRTISPEANVAEPEWVADLDRAPAGGTKVRVRIQREP